MTGEIKTVQVKLVKSPWGRLPKHRECVKGLGLRRIGSRRELVATPAVLGMIDKVAYLLEVRGTDVDAREARHAHADGTPQ